jgi:hypothetical protein
MTMTRPDLSGTARCGECGGRAEYPVPGNPDSGPLVIRHELPCPEVQIPTDAISEADRVIVDERYGHVSVVGPHGTGRAQVTFADLGPVLSLWSYQGLDLSPELARSLGEALVAWADKKNPPPFDLMVTLTGEAMYEVVEATAGNDDFPIKTLRLALDEGTFKVKVNERGWSRPITDGVLIQKGHEIP